jgi:hypothetical protein
VEQITGAALLTGCFVPLALTVLAPVIVNIVAVHLFLDPSGFSLTILVVVLELFLASPTLVLIVSHSKLTLNK